MSNVRKGKISSVTADGVRVMNPVNKGDITKTLKVPDYINAEDLEKGTMVAYVIYPDMNGAIVEILEE